MQNYDTFISYETTTGTSYAEHLKEALEKYNEYSCFLAHSSICSSKKGGKEIEFALDNCKYFIVIITRSALKSDEVKKECNRAIGLDKRIILCRDKNIGVSKTGELSELQQKITFEDKYDLANKTLI